MNTANLQLEGLVMAVAELTKMAVDKGLFTHQEVTAALARAEDGVRMAAPSNLSEANQSAKLFPIRVLHLANQAAQRDESFNFSDYAQLVGKLT
ncbi:hypothetical protein ACQKKX_07810 [Neorhizobium sp. NPDC001467]|uniref:hypothetical protein n=1 Tax=Neorhizobium sp. NPDC001467 TaxID=3390595 RepID=UPI003CFCA2A7